MSLRSQILSTPETLSDLEWAAAHRFAEAETLLNGRHFSGAVYLFGLAVEMWLKVASFHARGAVASTTIDSQLGPAKTWMKLRWPAISPESFHSLLFRTEYLVRYREAIGRPLPSTLAGETRHHVSNRLYREWKIDLRYRAVTITELAAYRVYNDAAWIKRTHRLLWR